MAVRDKLTLRIWENDFGAPSISPECIELMMNFKIHGISYGIINANWPQWKSIPSMKLNRVELTDSKVMLKEALKFTNGASVDCKLSPTGRLCLQKRTNRFENSFKPLFSFTCWLDKTNFFDVTVPAYKSIIPFPFCVQYVREKVSEVFDVQTDLSIKTSKSKEDVIRMLFTNSISCLQKFEKLLQDNRPYLMGNFPTTLDSLVYSHLVLTLKIPFSNMDLQNTVVKYEKLVRYVDRLTKEFFPLDQDEFKFLKANWGVTNICTRNFWNAVFVVIVVIIISKIINSVFGF